MGHLCAMRQDSATTELYIQLLMTLTSFAAHRETLDILNQKTQQGNSVGYLIGENHTKPSLLESKRAFILIGSIKEFYKLLLITPALSEGHKYHIDVLNLKHLVFDYMVSLFKKPQLQGEERLANLQAKVVVLNHAKDPKHTLGQYFWMPRDSKCSPTKGTLGKIFNELKITEAEIHHFGSAEQVDDEKLSAPSQKKTPFQLLKQIFPPAGAAAKPKKPDQDGLEMQGYTSSSSAP